MLTYGAIADAYKPRWFVWENVPGVLSSNKGRDFGTFLGMLARIGYGFAYRVLDAQFFGVPQRRRRVFVVGCLGDWRSAASVLFESESLQGDTKEGRKKRVQVARCVTAGTGRRIDAETETLIAFHGRQDPIFSETMLPLEAKGGQCVLQTAKTKEVKDASSQEKDTRRILRILWQKIGEKAFTQWGFGILISFYPQEILRQALHGSGLRLPARTRDWLVYNALSCEENCSARFMLTLREAECERYSPQGWEPSEQLARQLGAYMSKLSQPAASGEKVLRDLWSTAQGFGVLRQTLSALQEVGRSTNCKAKPTYSMQVRRLAPEECEFLQGFPRNHTRIPWRGKPAEDCPDGPRYKALGNSMAVPVMRWIGERIRKYETANYNPGRQDQAAERHT
jgi:DNA (cytosine-5)-methyltransferase 1